MEREQQEMYRLHRRAARSVNAARGSHMLPVRRAAVALGRGRGGPAA